jgi:hypothetical protein
VKPAAVWLAVEAGAIAVMLWLIPASVHISSWPDAGPVRIAYLAPLSRLYLAIAVAGVVVAACGVAWRAGGRAIDDLYRILAPILCLWLWIVPFLPWLPDRAPLLLILAGPIRWPIAAFAVIGVVVAWTRSRAAVRVRGTRPRRLVVFAISFALYAALGLRSANEMGFGGDEPHYLIITQSLLADHDLDIGNNHERREYRAFFPGELRPDFLRRGVHGEVYSIHAPGLPALLLPAYAAYGARGALLFMALLAALTALAVFELCTRIAGAGPGTVAWAATCFTIPFVPHAWLIYPELPGALIVAWAALWLYEPPAPTRSLAVHGAALAVLPWLHTKFVIFVAAFVLFELIRIWPRVKECLALVLPVAISGALWLLSFYWMYGEFNPEAPYGTYTRMFVLAANIPRGVLGLLFDQKFGILAFSPVYLLAGAGAWTLLRNPQRRLYAAELTVTAAAFLISSTRLYMWWGGSSPPARFLVPMVPLLAPMIAVAAAEARGVLARSVLVSAVVLTIGLAVMTLASPGGRLLYSDPHGVSSLVKTIQGSAPLDVALPTFTEENWRTPIRVLLPWLAALAVVSFALVTAVRRGWLRSVFWTTAAGSVGTLFLAALVLGARPVSNRQSVTVRGQLSLMREYDPTRLRAFDATHFKRLGPDEALAVSALSLQRRAGEEIANPRVLEGPFELPEGAFEAQVWFTGNVASDVFVALSDDVVLARTKMPGKNPAVVSFDLPLRTPAFVGVSDVTAARAVSRVVIRPLTLVPQSARDANASHVVEPVGGEIPGYMAYADDHTYPENGVFWTRDTQQGSIVVVTAGASTLRLVLHVGPTGGPIAIEVGGQSSEVEMRPDETRELSFPLTPGTRRVAVSVKSARSFRPADVDPRSDDRRLLGCQVRPLLS